MHMPAAFAKTARNEHVVLLYNEGKTYPKIANEAGCSEAVVKQVITRAKKQDRVAPRRPFQPRPVWAALRLEVESLARDRKMDAREIAAHLGDRSTLGSINQMLYEARLNGRIGQYDGMAKARRGNRPKPQLHLFLERETRLLVDGEAEDLGITPGELAARIIKAVMNDQELLEAAIGSQE